jgi:hypothetical protein
MTLPKLLGFLNVRSTKDKSVDSKHSIITVTAPEMENVSCQQGHVTDDAPLTPSTASSLYESDVHICPPLVLEPVAKDLDKSIGENARTVSRASTASGGFTGRSVISACSTARLSKVLGDIDAIVCDMDDEDDIQMTISRVPTARSGGFTARSFNSACSSKPLSKVLREIDAIPCDMDDDLHASVQPSVLEGEVQRQPRVLKTALSDVEKFIDANARTISDTLTARSGNLTARSLKSACSSPPIAKIMRDIDAF